MARSYLESTLAGTLPSFVEAWDAHRLSFSPTSPPDDAAFLAAFRAHLVSLLSAGRVAETSRFFYALERLLGEADPILRDLLHRDVIRALAVECQLAGIDSRRVEPYLGERSRVVWSSPSAERP